jgi:DNA-binding IclR family transcriptional regulator
MIPSRTGRGYFTIVQNERMDVVTMATSRLKKLAERLSHELRVSVFDDQTTSLVEQLRPQLDLQRLAKKEDLA